VRYIYILRCADKSLYVGHTDNPEARKRAHDAGTASSHTAKRRPLEIVYVESCNSLKEAVKRERQLKRWSHAKKEALITGDTDALHALANDNADSLRGWTTVGDSRLGLRERVPLPHQPSLMNAGEGCSP